MKRLWTSLVVVLLASIAYVTDAQALTLGFDGTWSGYARCESLSGEGPFRSRRVVVEISGGQANKIYGADLGEKLYAKVGEGQLKIWGKYYWERWKDIRFSGKLYNDNVRLTGKRGPRKCVVTLTRQSTLKADDASTSTASTSDQYVWCATASNFFKIKKSSCNKHKGGKSYSSRDQALAEHNRLKATSTATASTSDQYVWCATANSVLYIPESSCRSSGGQSWLYKHLADAEHNRLEVLQAQREQYAQLQKDHQALQETHAASESQSQRAIGDLKAQIAALEAQVKEKQQVAVMAQSETAAAEESYAQLQKDHQALQETQVASESQSQRTIDDLKTQIATLEAQVKEAKEASSAAAQETLTLSEKYAALQQRHKDIQQVAEEAKQGNESIAAKNKQLLTDYAALEKAHKELDQELKTLKVEYEPLRQEREARLAAERQRFEAQAALAEQLVSDVQAFMTQNPNLPELIALLQLTRKLKASITEEKLELLETSYNELTAALEDIPVFAVFFEQQAKAEQVAAE